jgi:hypothetical protein
VQNEQINIVIDDSQQRLRARINDHDQQEKNDDLHLLTFMQEEINVHHLVTIKLTASS